MAHFAKVEDGVVTQVVVVDNAYEDNGNEYLNSIGLIGDWVQTSYNSNIRGKFASKGDLYDPVDDVFYSRQPFPSWTLDQETKKWQPPTPQPSDDLDYRWDEETLSWVEILEA